MKIYKLKYFTNFYSNGGNRTHITEVYEEETNITICKMEEDRANDTKRKIQPFITGNNTLCLCDAMKYREDFHCSLLLSDKDVEYLRNKPDMNTYFPRHEQESLSRIS